MAKLTRAAWLILRDQTSEALRKFISLPESVDGAMPSDSQIGPMTDQCGQEAVRASHLAKLDCEKEQPTHATSGRSSIASSASAALQLSLENKLRARMDAYGSPEYALTWKHWDMESGLPICALRAFPLPISDRDFSGWPTPQALSFDQSHQPGMNAQMAKTLAIVRGWPSPRANKRGPSDSHGFSPLAAVQLGWATPTAITNTGGAALCKWGGTGSRAKLREAVGNTLLNGALAPAFPLWLMGYPIEWARCAEQVMPSSHKSRQNLSKRPSRKPTGGDSEPPGHLRTPVKTG